MTEEGKKRHAIYSIGSMKMATSVDERGIVISSAIYLVRKNIDFFAILLALLHLEDCIYNFQYAVPAFEVIRIKPLIATALKFVL